MSVPSEQPVSANGRRPRLDGERILATALEIANAHGIDALTIRRLAEQLGVTPMAIYRYFPNKRAILDGLLDHVVGVYDVTAHDNGDWRDWICASFLNMRSALVACPGILPVLGTTGSSGLNALAVTEEVLGVLRNQGIDSLRAARLFYSLISYTIGSATLESAYRSQQLEMGEQDDEEWRRRSSAILQTLPRSSYPNVVACADELVMSPSDHQFVEGLHLILAGVGPD